MYENAKRISTEDMNKFINHFAPEMITVPEETRDIIIKEFQKTRVASSYRMGSENRKGGYRYSGPRIYNKNKYNDELQLIGWVCIEGKFYKEESDVSIAYMEKTYRNVYEVVLEVNENGDTKTFFCICDNETEVKEVLFTPYEAPPEEQPKENKKKWWKR